jgi:branched-chain amino acid transport system substrate-binding protein
VKALAANVSDLGNPGLVIDLRRGAQQSVKRETPAIRKSAADQKRTRSHAKEEPAMVRDMPRAMLRVALIASVMAAGAAMTTPLHAQSKVYIPAVLELSGAGAVSGTNFRDGMLMAIDEINAKGGILGRKIDTPLLDTQSDASVSRAQIQKVLDNDPYVILGPVFSGSVLVDMALTQNAEIPEIVGGEAAAITQKNDPYVFRTSFGQQFSMPKIANYIRDGVKAKTVAVIWVNNDFGKGGRDTFVKEMAARDIKVVADVSTESGQADFSADVVKINGANADAIFVYLNEEESARFLREAKKQGVKAPLIGETTLLGQKVIDLAQGAAEGVRGHVGLTVDAPIPAVQDFAARFKKRYNYVCDHNGIKGYTSVYFIKYVTEKIGKFDGKLFAKTLHGLTITPKDEPGVLMEASFDNNGDIDRESFLGEVVDGKQKIVAVLPKLGK